MVNDHAEFEMIETKEGFFDVFEVRLKKFISDRLIRKIEEYNSKGFANMLVLAEVEDETEDEPKKKGKKFTPITISENGLELIEYVSLDCTNANGVWNSDTEIKIDKLGYVVKNGKKSKEFWDGIVKSDKKPKRIMVRNISGDEIIVDVG